MYYWNPWHGCTKISTGCKNCYVDRLDKRFGRDPNKFFITQSLEYPSWKHRNGTYHIPSDNIVFTCYTSDFFLKDADEVRDKAWDIIRSRPDLHFYIITKRINRFMECIPSDWNDGWDNVEICSTCEDQDRADYRIPILMNAPIKYRSLCLEPLLEYINLSDYLKSGKIENIVCGGESGSGARVCNYEWVKKISDDCKRYEVPFCFKQTGARFVDQNGVLHTVARKNQFENATKLRLSSYELDDLDNKFSAGLS